MLPFNNTATLTWHRLQICLMAQCRRTGLPGRCTWCCILIGGCGQFPASLCIWVVWAPECHWNATAAEREKERESIWGGRRIRHYSWPLCSSAAEVTFSALDRIHLTKYGSDWSSVSISLLREACKHKQLMSHPQPNNSKEVNWCYKLIW